MNDVIRQIDLTQVDAKKFSCCHVGCIVLTQDKKILLQQRCDNWRTFPGYLATFGGHIEKDETPMQALVRELNEEVGADVKENDVIKLGAITEKITGYSELIYIYFWHDKQGTITGCYECEAKYYDNVAAVLEHHTIMDDVRFLLKECRKRKLLK